MRGARKVGVICGSAERVLELVAGQVSTEKHRTRGRVTGGYILSRVANLVDERRALRATLDASRFPPDGATLAERVRQLVVEHQALVDRWVEAELLLKANGLPVPRAEQGRATSGRVES